MADRVTYSDFTGFRAIPNLSDDLVNEALTEAITRLEARFFIEVFGYEFQKLMLADATNPIYASILDGVEYTNSSDKLVKWEGINESIANYIYFYYIKENNPSLSGSGYNVGSNENSTFVQPITKPNMVFNFINPALTILYDYLYINSDDYPTLDFCNKEKLNDFGI